MFTKSSQSFAFDASREYLTPKARSMQMKSLERKSEERGKRPPKVYFSPARKLRHEQTLPFVFDFFPQKKSFAHKFARIAIDAYFSLSNAKYSERYATSPHQKYLSMLKHESRFSSLSKPDTFSQHFSHCLFGEMKNKLRNIFTSKFDRVFSLN